MQFPWVFYPSILAASGAPGLMSDSNSKDKVEYYSVNLPPFLPWKLSNVPCPHKVTSFRGSHYLALYHFCTLDKKLDIKICITALREWRNLSLTHWLWHLACITFPLLSNAPAGKSEYQYPSNNMNAVSADRGESPVW